ncbi:hypothetical protein FHS19_000275 [Paenibacillus rhizosphaerae]|uniref:Uncharacterized protein n=1 Tax=Paenibacillus rhizosphaerae TaxID=297318 RepID=A0A839TFY8_9BACL|nr:hypothetical protein [Paenibacillus rhizosphaerae]MBB3125621.1 hypothetical protein [Paenibacillus rhizosphaerae]
MTEINRLRDLTTFMIHCCYTCPKAYECTTEEQCLACWKAKQTGVEEKPDAETTEELLKEYAL